MRACAWVLAVFGTAGVIGACSTFTSSADAPDGGAVDSSVPPEDAAPDAQSDDAGFDASDSNADADAEAGSPCAVGKHVFCEDFDGPTPLSGWTDFDDAGAVVMPYAGAPTQPDALVATAGGTVNATIGRTDALTSSHGISCAFDVDVTARGPEAVLLVLTLNTPSAFYRVELHVIASGVDLVEEYGKYPDGGSLALFSTPTYFGMNAWKHVSIAMGFGPAARLTVAVDGAESVSMPKYDLSSMPDPTSLTVSVGTATYAGSGTTVIAIDDVVCDVIP